MRNLIAAGIIGMVVMAGSTANAQQNWQQMADQAKAQAQQSLTSATTYKNNTLIPEQNLMFASLPIDANGNILQPKPGWTPMQVMQYEGLVGQGNAALQAMNTATQAAISTLMTYSSGMSSGDTAYGNGDYQTAFNSYSSARMGAGATYLNYVDAYNAAVQAYLAYSSATAFWKNN